MEATLFVGSLDYGQLVSVNSTQQKNILNTLKYHIFLPVRKFHPLGSTSYR